MIAGALGCAAFSVGAGALGSAVADGAACVVFSVGAGALGSAAFSTGAGVAACGLASAWA